MYLKIVTQSAVAAIAGTRILVMSVMLLAEVTAGTARPRRPALDFVTDPLLGVHLPASIPVRSWRLGSELLDALKVHLRWAIGSTVHSQ